MVGDVAQLPPTVLSRERKKDLSRSLMERLLTMGTLPSFMLTVQHRSHPKIAEFSSRMFYGGQIVSTPDDAYLLSGEGHIGQNIFTTNPLVLISTHRMSENMAMGTKSYHNDGECQVVTELVQRLVDSGINASSMSVLTPYAAQVISLSSRLRMSHPEVTVSTIDRSQGDIFITSVETNEGSPGLDFRFREGRGNSINGSVKLER